MDRGGLPAARFGAVAEAVATQLGAARERRLLRSFGPPFAPVRRSDPARAWRAGLVFGMRGGELCGCHSPACAPCAANRGCGADGCELCVGLGYRPARRREPRESNAVGAGQWAEPGAGSGDWQPISRHAKKAIDDGGAGSGFEPGLEVEGGPTVVPDPGWGGELYDVHAHNFCASELDWVHSKIEAAERIDRLATMAEAGVGRSTLMGSRSGAGSGLVQASRMINQITDWGWRRHPDFLVPFCHIVTTEIADPAARVEVERCIAKGFRGVGELYVHGHGEELPLEEVAALVEIFEPAAAAGIPVSVHWEFGTTEAGKPSGDHTWFHLVRLLDALDLRGLDFKLIVCHCGAGPNADQELTYMPDASGRFSPALARYLDRLDHLLTRDNVYFDLAGMQIDEDGSHLMGSVQRLYTEDNTVFPPLITLTPLGTELLRRIIAHPTRFLVGTDVDDREDTDTASSYGVASYQASVGNYDSFLAQTWTDPVSGDSGSADIGTIYLVKYGNAKRLIDG